MIEDFVQMDEKMAHKAGKMMSDMLDNMKKLQMDPDYVAYLLLSAGFGIAVATNRQSPVVVNQLTGAAMMVANKNLLEQEREEEEEEWEQEQEDGTRH